MPTLLNMAERHNPLIASARSQADARHFGAQAVRDSLGLRITSSAGLLYDPIEEKKLIARTELEDLNREETFNSTIVDARVTFSYPVFAKSIGLQADAEEAAGRVADSQIETTKNRIFLSIVQIYYQILMVEEALKAANASIEALQETKRGIGKKIEVGRAPRIDMFRIDSRLSKTQLDLLNFSNEKRKRRLELETLVGVTFPDQAVIEGELRRPEVDFEREESVRFALDTRPEVRSGTFALQQAQALENVADSIFSPKINLILEPSVNWGNDAQQAVEDFFVGARISMPIFDPTYSAKQQKARANFSAKKWRLVNIQQKVRFQVETALLDLDKARESIGVTEKLLKVSREAFRVEQVRYKNGFSTVNDVLQAQAALLQAELASARSLIQYNVGWAHVFWARGDMTIENLSP